MEVGSAGWVRVEREVRRRRRLWKILQGRVLSLELLDVRAETSKPTPKEDGRKVERSPYDPVDEAPGVGRGKKFRAYSRPVQREVRLSWHCPAGG